MVDSLQSKWVPQTGGQLMLSVTQPIQKTSEQTHDGARNVLSVIPDFFRTRAQNVALKRRVSELEQELITLHEEMMRDGRIRDLDEYGNSIEGKKLVARVIGINPTVWFSAVIIDKGSSNGIERFMPAVSASGLAGYVVEVYRYSSKILLLSDPNSKVSVMTQRSRARGVVQGDEAGACLLKYVEATADVKEGDILITSGNSKIYPEGLLVGRVEALARQPGDLFQQARVSPETDFEKLEEVAIILTSPPREPGGDVEGS
jgi:rod shape-determining protein MreC